MKNRIREYRIKRNISQDELARLSDVSRVMISKLETNKLTSIKLDTMKKIAKALKEKVSVIFLVDM
jgi:hypothetical protein|nr:MAG TPA: Helix-turn-helix XRE-family like protein [Caudoviricetes sp.]